MGLLDRFLKQKTDEFEIEGLTPRERSEYESRNTDHACEPFQRLEVLVDDIPVIYDERSNRWEFVLGGKAMTLDSLAGARSLIMTMPEAQRHVYDGPRTALTAYEISTTPAGTRVQIVSSAKWIGTDGKPFTDYRVRINGSAMVRLGAHNMVADTPENERAFEEYRAMERSIDQLRARKDRFRDERRSTLKPFEDA